MIANLSINAGAGTGKTTTIVEGSRVALGGKSPFKPSEQQAAIWDHLSRLLSPKTSCRFVAFNKSIATELASRLPASIPASTMHSFGLSSLTKHLGRAKIEGGKVRYLLQDHFQVNPKKDADFLGPMTSLVSLTKVTLTDPSDREEVLDLIQHYGVDLNGNTTRALTLLPQVIDYCRDNTSVIDFDDMVWLPVVHDLPLEKSDVLLVDERQDLNRVQQELVLRSGNRVVGVGDPRQAIYGFAGADANAFVRLNEQMALREGGLVEMPLLQTRRCPRLVVKAVSHLAPGFEALPEAPEGEIYNDVPWDVLTGTGKYRGLGRITPGDMVLCRTNAPLVSLCYSYLRKDIPATIQGRSIGAGLIALIKKSKQASIAGLMTWLTKYESAEIERLSARKRGVESALAALEDKINCLVTLTEGQDTLDEVIRRIETLFQDAKAPGSRVLLSSIHKAKGLEADRVWIARPELLPGPWAKQEWELEQERNLEYVAKTRTKNILALVPGTDEMNKPRH